MVIWNRSDTCMSLFRCKKIETLMLDLKLSGSRKADSLKSNTYLLYSPVWIRFNKAGEILRHGNPQRDVAETKTTFILLSAEIEISMNYTTLYHKGLQSSKFSKFQLLENQQMNCHQNFRNDLLWNSVRSLAPHTATIHQYNFTATQSILLTQFSPIYTYSRSCQQRVL